MSIKKVTIEHIKKNSRFGVLAAVFLRIRVWRDVTPCLWVRDSRRCGGQSLLQCQRNTWPWRWKNCIPSKCLETPPPTHTHTQRQGVISQKTRILKSENVCFVSRIRDCYKEKGRSYEHFKCVSPPVTAFTATLFCILGRFAIGHNRYILHTETS